MLKVLLKKLFPYTIKEIERDIRDSYFELGVRIEIKYPQFKLPTEPLIEGTVPEIKSFKPIKRAYIANGFEQGIECNEL